METGSGKALIAAMRENAVARRLGTTASNSELAMIMGSTWNPGTRTASLRLMWCRARTRSIVVWAIPVESATACFDPRKGFEIYSSAKLRVRGAYDTYVVLLQDQGPLKSRHKIVEDANGAIDFAGSHGGAWIVKRNR